VGGGDLSVSRPIPPLFSASLAPDRDPGCRCGGDGERGTDEKGDCKRGGTAERERRGVEWGGEAGMEEDEGRGPTRDEGDMSGGRREAR
jgi:hypothetical protein